MSLKKSAHPTHDGSDSSTTRRAPKQNQGVRTLGGVYRCAYNSAGIALHYRGTEGDWSITFLTRTSGSVSKKSQDISTARRLNEMDSDRYTRVPEVAGRRMGATDGGSGWKWLRRQVLFALQISATVSTTKSCSSVVIEGKSGSEISRSHSREATGNSTGIQPNCSR
jgi:hypothetical protein